MKRSGTRSVRGNASLVLTWGLAFAGLLALALVLSSSGAEERRRTRSRYLSEERSALPGRSQARQEAERAAAERVKKARSRAGFQHASAARIFAARGTEEDAVHAELREIVGSADVVVRLYGTPHGDYLFHRKKGWLRFVDGKWVAVAFRDLPGEIRLAHPELRRPGHGKSGDAEFQESFWMNPAEDSEA